MQNANPSPLADSVTRALRSLFTPGMVGVILLSIMFTLLCLAGFVTTVTLISGALSSSWFASIIGGTIAFVIAWFLFPGIMPVIVNFFDTKIMTVIERHDYPNLPPVTEPAFWPEFFHDARFTLMTLTLNLFAFMFIWIPPLYFVLFYSMNGYLLGREFFIVAARRRIGVAAALDLFRAHRARVFYAGLLLTICATIPIINLCAPLWGIALMTHLYHALVNTVKTEILLPNT